ncbi:MAG: TlyA family RNA methyltransferase, partial [Clostridia bacterium]|nr:TlyA family RNA methyltransferase [Clostridia bacterium]
MRADVYLFEKGYADSRTRAASLIGAGSVRIDGKTVKKPSFELDPDAAHAVEISDACPYVSRGGLKLEHALTQFCIDVKDLAALDVGASTGGFTDCLLKHGAKAVCAVDNGSGQLHPSLAADPRVRSVENCNARYLTGDTLGFSPDLIVM